MDLTACHCRRAGAEQERGNGAGGTEYSSPDLARTHSTSCVGPKRKGRPTQDDADQRQGKGEKESCREHREGRWESREQSNEQKDQPDVISFPDRPKCLPNQAALFFRLGTNGQKVPDATAEVGSSKHGIGNQRKPQHSQYNIC